MKVILLNVNKLNMSNTAVKIAVIESEAGWGRRIDDYMVCLTYDEVKEFEKEFNSKNTSITVPDWYMQVEGEPIQIELTNSQFEKLQIEKRIWLSALNKIYNEYSITYTIGCSIIRDNS